MPHTCPVCQQTCDSMLPFGEPPRAGAKCPHCSALERHRLIWLYLTNEKAILTRPYTVLHIAPEPCLRKNFLALPNISYTDIDLDPRHAANSMDITRLEFADNSFDVVLCSHVLEHIPRDRRAMFQLRRVLKPGGFALLLVPVRNMATTYENPEADTPEKRLQYFGQADHVRIYGRDFKTRLESAGFRVEALVYKRAISPDLAATYCLTDEVMHVCYKD